MSAESYRAFYASNRELVLRTQAIRRRAKRLGLRLVASHDQLSLYDDDGQLVAFSGGLDDRAQTNVALRPWLAAVAA